MNQDLRRTNAQFSKYLVVNNRATLQTALISGILYPLQDGTEGQIIVTNGEGKLVFTDEMDPFINYTHTAVASNYTVTFEDDIIGVDTSNNPVTITLPEIQDIGGKIYIITDEGGNAGINNITVETTGSDLILGETEVIINSDYNSITLYNNGTNWFLK